MNKNAARISQLTEWMWTLFRVLVHNAFESCFIHFFVSLFVFHRCTSQVHVRSHKHALTIRLRRADRLYLPAAETHKKKLSLSAAVGAKFSLGISVCTMKSSSSSSRNGLLLICQRALLSSIPRLSFLACTCISPRLSRWATTLGGKIFGRLKAATRSLRLPLATASLDRLQRSHQNERSQLHPHKPPVVSSGHISARMSYDRNSTFHFGSRKKHTQHPRWDYDC